MGHICSSNGCFVNEEERSTYYFSNSFPFKDRFFPRKEDVSPKKNYLLIDNSIKKPCDIKNTDIEKDTVNISNLDFSFMDNGGEKYEYTEKNFSSFLAKSKENKLNTNNIEKEIVVDLVQKEEKLVEKPVKNVLGNLDLSKLTKIQYKFLFYLFRKKFDSLKKELQENAQKFYHSKLSKFESKETNYHLFDNKLFESTYFENLDAKGIEKQLLLNTKILLKNNTFYSGQINLANKKNGLGKLRLADKTSYEGFWINDVFLCGRYIDISGNLLEGTFIEDKLCGFGTKITKDETFYKGSFINGLKSGEGTERSKLYMYNGNFVKDMKHGKGKIHFIIQDEEYEGEFYEGKLTGKGIFKWKNKDSYIGDVVNRKMHGIGKYIWQDGSEYEGEYVDNIKEGKGKFKWNNGNIYEGKFSKGVPHGEGILHVKGSKYECEFTDGKLTYKGDMIV